MIYSARLVEVDPEIEELAVIQAAGQVLTVFAYICPFRIYVGRWYEVDLTLASLDGPFLQEATPNAQIGLQRDGDSFRHRVVGWLHGAVLDAGVEFEDGLFASEYAYLDGKRVSLTVDRINAEFRREVERPPIGGVCLDRGDPAR